MPVACGDASTLETILLLLGQTLLPPSAELAYVSWKQSSTASLLRGHCSQQTRNNLNEPVADLSLGLACETFHRDPSENKPAQRTPLTSLTYAEEPTRGQVT